MLALRFDRRHIATHGTQAYAKPYFTATLLAYVLGLLATFAVLIIFRAAQVSGRSALGRGARARCADCPRPFFVMNARQPALLYLSPACILGVLLPALFRGEIAQVWNFNTTPKDAADAAKPADGSVAPAAKPAEEPATDTSATTSAKARARPATKRSAKA